MVRCAGCGASWRVALAGPPEPRLAPAPRPAPPIASIDDEDELFEPDDVVAPGEPLPRAFRARAEAERRTKEAAVQGAIWAGMGAVFALLVGAGVVFRSDVVRIWPKTASAYASVGMPVNPVGLSFEDVHFQHALQDGHPALVVTGVLRNIRPQLVNVPPLQIRLYDKQGRTLLTRTASAGDPQLAPGQARSFTVSLLDPPVFADHLDVDFATGPALSRPRAEARPVPIAQLRTRTLREDGVPALPRALMVGPPIPEAKPLPPGSPYALPHPAGGGT
jgi:hypothetical protein